ncbi:MAG: threonine synthase [Ignavibacteria bacterium]|nr:threonine synthase [Ignavibacteria bacterium]
MIVTNYLTHLECSVCGDRHSPHEVQTVCRSCGRSLLARYDLTAAQQSLRKEGFRDQRGGLWKFAPLLPIEQEEHMISLGEVVTPLLPMVTLAKELGIAEILVKEEGYLPTGSFKARGLATGVSKAKELGVKEMCIPSAGNAAGALAAYASRAGMTSHIFIPEDTPVINIKECKAYGARVVLVKGNISDAARAMNEEKKNNPGWFDISTLKEPYRLEGKKTIGYELGEQYDWNLPDVIIYPTGGGTGLIGMWKAFEEMETMGWIGSKRPKMVTAQVDGCAPIVKAFREKKKESEFWSGAETIASGLRVPKAFADYLILDTIYKSAGSAVSVSDQSLIEAVYEIAQKEGLFMCPEGAATYVTLKILTREGFVKPTDRVLLFNTAAGNKYPEVIS